LKTIERSYSVLQQLRESGAPIYGATTGFGPFVRYASGGSTSEDHALGLLEHLGAGAGPSAPSLVVRCAMLVRLLTVCRGCSGIRPEVVDAYLALFNSGAAPDVPALGSLGASGDLVPLAHVARALIGRGRVHIGGRWRSAASLQRAGAWPRPRFEPRDSLALVNGTSFSTAWASVALVSADRLIRWSEWLTAYAYATLGCNTQALHPALHAARGQAGQIASAASIRDALAGLGGGEIDPSRPLQEIYSLRCAPQVLGACREQLEHARRLIEADINGVDDNPVLVAPSEEFPDGAALHGGNFHAQQVAFAADSINGALTQAAILADRQIDLLSNPAQNGGAPLLLARVPGAQSGLAGAQITASAIISEMRGRCQQHATSSVPTNGGNQDIVPMAATAARAAHDQAGHHASVLSVLSLALDQLNHLRKVGAAPGRPASARLRLPSFSPLDKDRALRGDIARRAEFLLETGPESCRAC
jgi:histidine ammonia-lyase/tyrosine ammonia-lyase